jgi:hypothetical protein
VPSLFFHSHYQSKHALTLLHMLRPFHILMSCIFLSLMTFTLNTISYKHVIYSSLSTVSQPLFFSSWLLLMQVGRYIRVQIMEVDEVKNNVILSEKEAWVSTKIGASRCLVSNLQFSVVTRSSFPCLQTLISCLNYWAFSFSSFEISAVKSIRCCRKSYILEKEHFLKGL